MLQEKKPLPADGLNTFAVDLYRRLSAESGNIFLSPLSIASVLAMAYAGARGETAKQMAQALHLASEDAVHAALGALLRELNAKGERHGFELVVANALWGQRGYAFFPEFLDVIQRTYGGELHAVDFGEEGEAARLAINQWVEEKTRDKIKEIIAPGMLDPLARLVLTNAVYFKGAWTQPFERTATHSAPFRTCEGMPDPATTVRVPMMVQTSEFSYMEDENFQALEMSYGEQPPDARAANRGRGDLSMLVLLPRRADGLAELEASLTAEKLAAWLPKLQTQEVVVSVPKFKMTLNYALGEILRAMGVRDAFNLAAADFSGMTEQEGIAVSEIAHKAFVDVNEEGTEAAAATGMAVLGCADEIPIPVFRADHPFLFLIRDTRSGVVLFLGRLADPKALDESP